MTYYDPPPGRISDLLTLLSADGAVLAGPGRLTFNGRDPSCTDHRPGEPHPPCWTWTPEPEVAGVPALKP